MKITICLPLIPLLYFSPANAQQFEDLNAMDVRVAAVLQSTGGTARPVDRRLKLARCPEPIILDQSSTDAIAVRCNPIGWRVRVPVSDRMRADGVGDILVRRGETVEIVIKGYDYEVVTSGIAVEDGAMGKYVRVKSSTGAAPISATVVAQAKVFIED